MYIQQFSTVYTWVNFRYTNSIYSIVNTGIPYCHNILVHISISVFTSLYPLDTNIYVLSLTTVQFLSSLAYRRVVSSNNIGYNFFMKLSLVGTEGSVSLSVDRFFDVHS